MISASVTGSVIDMFCGTGGVFSISMLWILIWRKLGFLYGCVSSFNAHGKKVEGIVNIHVNDVLLAGSESFKDKVIKHLSKCFQIRSADKNDIVLWTRSPVERP